MKITFIRHGYTRGNLEHRYIGRTDEPLSAYGIKEIQKRLYPKADHVITSPMKRCIETAQIIYPNIKPIVAADFRECDFGDFEGKSYTELNGDPYYQKWIDSGGEISFPNGESPQDFRERCCTAFINEINKLPQNASVSLVVHGGTVMSILSRFFVPKRSYFDFQIKNGCGFQTEWDGQKILSELI
ncbi:MAG: histidine phosphatase family protein [Clostridium sp.]|nr:histidine phosphatase family protein [Clostridium sp.]MCM1546992.1 histidine phosphatase family protein [Ruminococcus sp.]